MNLQADHRLITIACKIDVHLSQWPLTTRHWNHHLNWTKWCQDFHVASRSSHLWVPFCSTLKYVRDSGVVISIASKSTSESWTLVHGSDFVNKVGCIFQPSSNGARFAHLSEATTLYLACSSSALHLFSQATSQLCQNHKAAKCWKIS